MQLLRLVKNQVKVGSPLPFGVRDSAGKLLLARGNVVPSDQILEALLARGAYVDAVEVEALRRGLSDANRSASLLDQWEQLYKRVDALLHSVEQPRLGERAAECAQQLQALVEADADLAIFLILQHPNDRPDLYGVRHSIHAAVVAYLIARRVQMPATLLVPLLEAALTMNVSIVDLQCRLAAQTTPLTAAQKQAVAQHARKSVWMLEQSGITHTQWLDAIWAHHDMDLIATEGDSPQACPPAAPAAPEPVDAALSTRPDAQSALPSRIPGAVGREMAKIIRHADIFTAIMQPRATRLAMAPNDAERQLFLENRGSTMAASVVKEFGLYPPGSYVKLANGETAVVVGRGESANTPWVASLVNRNGSPLIPPVRRDTRSADWQVCGVVPEKTVKVRIAPGQLFDLKGG